MGHLTFGLWTLKHAKVIEDEEEEGKITKFNKYCFLFSKRKLKSSNQKKTYMGTYKNIYNQKNVTHNINNDSVLAIYFVME